MDPHTLAIWVRSCHVYEAEHANALEWVVNTWVRTQPVNTSMTLLISFATGDLQGMLNKSLIHLLVGQ